MSSLDHLEVFPPARNELSLDQAKQEVLSFLETHPISLDQQKRLLKVLHSFNAFHPFQESSHELSELIEDIADPSMQKLLQKLL